MTKIFQPEWLAFKGYLIASSEKNYLLKLDKNNNIVVDDNQFSKLVKINEKKSVVIIGYTYMIWSYLLNNKINNNKLNLNMDTKLIHFGGWKKLEEKKFQNLNLFTK